VVGHERHDAGGGELGGHEAEGLGEDGGHDGDVRRPAGSSRARRARAALRTRWTGRTLRLAHERAESPKCSSGSSGPPSTRRPCSRGGRRSPRRPRRGRRPAPAIPRGRCRNR
jgi:hypothetical protein